MFIPKNLPVTEYSVVYQHGLLTRYVKLQATHAPGMLGTLRNPQFYVSGKRPIEPYFSVGTDISPPFLLHTQFPKKKNSGIVVERKRYLRPRCFLTQSDIIMNKFTVYKPHIELLNSYDMFSVQLATKNKQQVHRLLRDMTS